MDVLVERVGIELSGDRILADVSTHVPAGASAAIVGVSGVGKTTLLRAVAGLLRPSWGRILVGGEFPQALHPRRVIGFLFQEAYLWRHLTVEEMLKLTYQLHERKPDMDHIEAMLARVGLSEARRLYPYQLSVGMKARAAIARAFCIPPRLLLMDEPFAAVDPLRRADLNSQTQALRQDCGCTILWVTHDIVEALQFATHVLVLAGRPARSLNLTNLENLPPITDSASLPAEALAKRDEILRLLASNGALP